MAQQTLTIEVFPRTSKKGLSKMRLGGHVPAVVYGPKVKNGTFSVAINDAVKYSRRGFENAIFTLKSMDKALDGIKVLSKSVDIHPVTRRPIHLDFFAPDMTKAVRVKVELKFEGKPLGLADGGIFNAIRRDIEIECLPTEIPEFITVDVSGIGIDESMHVSDVKIPDGLKLITSLDETIATVAVVQEEVAAPVAAAADPAAAAGAAPGAPAAGAAAPAAGQPAAGAAAPAKDAGKK